MLTKRNGKRKEKMSWQRYRKHSRNGKQNKTKEMGEEEYDDKATETETRDNGT